MKRYLQYILPFLMAALGVSCSGDLGKLLQEEINTVSARMPGVTILSPFDGEYVETLEKTELLDGGVPVKDSRGSSIYTIVDRPLVLRGSARRSDFSLIEDDSAYEWKSDRAGVLGKGATLELAEKLAPGDHIITLTVTGDYDKNNSSSVTVHIPRVYTEDFSASTYFDAENSSGAFDTAAKNVHLGSYPDLDAVANCELTLYSSADTMALSGNKAFIGDGSTLAGLSVVLYDTSRHAKYLGNLPTKSATPVTSIASYGYYVYAMSNNYGPDSVSLNIFTSDDNEYFSFTLKYDEMVNVELTDMIDASHIFVEESSPYAYVIGHYSTEGKSIVIYNLSTPGSPVYEGDVQVSESARRIFVSGTIGAVACGTEGFQLVDLTSKSGPALISTTPVPTPSRCYSLAVKDSYLYAACETGMYIYNIATPATPSVVSHVSTIGSVYNVRVLEGKAYISISSQGVGIVDVTNPSTPQIQKTSSNAGVISDMQVRINGDYTYILSSSMINGFTILSCDHSSMQRTGRWNIAMKDVAAYMNHAYIAADDGITVINYGDPTHMEYVTRLASDEPVNAVAACDSMLYAGYDDGTVRCFDISTPANPVERGSLSYSGTPVSIAANSSSAVCIAAGSTLYIADFSTPGSPSKKGDSDTGYTIDSIAVSGNIVYWAGSPRMGALNISNTSAPSQLEDYMELSSDGFSGISVLESVTNDVVYEWVFAAGGDNSSKWWIHVKDFIIPPDDPFQLDVGFENSVNVGYRFPQTLATSVLGNYVYFTSTDPLTPSEEHYVAVMYINVTDTDFTVFNTLRTGGKALRIFNDGTYLFINDENYGMSIIEPVKPYAGLYNSIDTQSVQSLTVSGGTNVSRARVFSCSVKNDQTITLEMSNNGGSTWFTADDRILLEFPFYSTPDGTLKWRATMKTTNRVVSPELYALKIEYWE